MSLFHPLYTATVMTPLSIFFQDVWLLLHFYRDYPPTFESGYYIQRAEGENFILHNGMHMHVHQPDPEASGYYWQHS